MPTTVQKRNKEKNRQEKQQEKAAKRRERKIEKENRPPPAPGVDPDIADIVPGPQPHPWNDADVAS
jgi:hypothetical protein